MEQNQNQNQATATAFLPPLLPCTMGISSKEAREKRKARAKAAAAARTAVQKHRLETEQKVNKLYATADAEGQDHLNGEGIGRLLQLLNEEDGEAPMDDTTLKSAVSFVLRAADKDSSGGVDKGELATAIAAWENWATTHDALGERVQKELKAIDKDLSGSLDTEELKVLLARLNGDVEVTEENIKKIIKKCDKRGNGVLDIEEIAPAITMWYQMVEDGHVESKTPQTITNTYGPDDGGGGAGSGDDGGGGKKVGGPCCLIC